MKAKLSFLSFLFFVFLSITLKFAFGLNINCDALPTSINIASGSTYPIVCSVLNQERVGKSGYIVVNISSNATIVERGEFIVNASVNLNNLNCFESELKNGTFTCLNNSSEYVFPSGKSTLNLNITSQPNLAPSTYTIDVYIMTSKTGVDNPNIKSVESIVFIKTGIAIITNLTNVQTLNQNTNVTVAIPNSNKTVSFNLTVPGSSTRQILSLENGIVVSPETAKIINSSYSESSITTGNTIVTNKTLVVETEGSGTQEIFVYVGDFGLPSQIMFITPYQTYLLQDFSFDSNKRTLIFKVTYASPGNITLTWISSTTIPTAPPAATGVYIPPATQPTLKRNLTLEITGNTTMVAGTTNFLIITVFNAGNFTENDVKISFSGIPQNWMNITPTSSTILAGSSQYYLATIAIPQNETGRKTITFTVNSSVGTTASKNITIEILPFNVSKPTPVCGNGICEPGEDSTTCPQDCKIAPTPSPSIPISGAIIATTTNPIVRTVFSVLIAFVIIVIAIRIIAQRRKPWRTRFEPSYSEKIMNSLKKQIKKALEEE